MRGRTGTAELPLHGGRAPAWLFSRMVRRARDQQRYPSVVFTVVWIRRTAFDNVVQPNQPTLLGEDSKEEESKESDAASAAQLAFTIWRVNDYDLQNPAQRSRGSRLRAHRRATEQGGHVLRWRAQKATSQDRSRSITR
jgi:hypothetical protein